MKEPRWADEMEAELRRAKAAKQRMAHGTYDQLMEAVGYYDGLKFALEAQQRLSYNGELSPGERKA